MRTLGASLVWALAAGVVLSLAPVAAPAEVSTPRCDLGDYDPTQRPDPEGTPTEVGVGVYVVYLDRVDNLDESYRLDAFFRLAWRDARLAEVVNAAGVERCRLPRASVWDPRVIIFNRQAASPLMPEEVSVDGTGRVLYLQRI